MFFPVFVNAWCSGEGGGSWGAGRGGGHSSQTGATPRVTKTDNEKNFNFVFSFSNFFIFILQNIAFEEFLIKTNLRHNLRQNLYKRLLILFKFLKDYSCPIKILSKNFFSLQIVKTLCEQILLITSRMYISLTEDSFVYVFVFREGPKYPFGPMHSTLF